MQKKQTGSMYGQVVCGPPGSGKTTYCNGMQQYLQSLGRNAVVINLDPANEVERIPSACDTIFDVCREVVSLSSVMDELSLGPNGGLVYCMEYLEAHVDEIIQLIQERIAAQREIQNRQTYLLIDLPGQVELVTHSTCVQGILHRLGRRLDLRLTAVQLMDAHYCTDANKFLSAALLGTTTMLRLELPMVSVLSKVDQLSQWGELPFALDFFTACHDLHLLVPFLDSGTLSSAEDSSDELDYADDPEYQTARQKTRQSKFFVKREKMQLALAAIVEDYGLLGFIPLDIANAESVGRVVARVDKSNGYVFASDLNPNEDMFQCAAQVENTFMSIADNPESM